jgi:hypothetical protein
MRPNDLKISACFCIPVCCVSQLPLLLENSGLQGHLQHNRVVGDKPPQALRADSLLVLAPIES